MATSGISQPPPFVIRSENAKQHWADWVENLNDYFSAAAITDADQKLSILKYCGGEDLRRIYKTLKDTIVLQTTKNPPRQIDVFTASLTVLNKRFSPKENLTFERSKFRSIVQKDGESALSFVTRLREQSHTCNFDNYNTECAIMDQFLEKCISRSLCKKLLATDQLTLEPLLKLKSCHRNMPRK